MVVPTTLLRPFARWALATTTTQKSWVTNYLKRYQAQGWYTVIQTPLRALSFAVDAKRIGQPCEETEAFFMHLYPADVSMWAPVQDIPPPAFFC